MPTPPNLPSGDNVFDDYAANRITLKDALARSGNWYTSRIQELAGITQQQILRDTSKYVKFPVRGDFYAFRYDPKHKDTLPYYDTFPLVLPLSIAPDRKSFLALNFHYIKPADRMYLLDAIKKRGGIGKDKTIITWEVISGWAGSKRAQHCLKRYLFTHLKTPLRKIDSKDVPLAMLVPIERFVNATKQSVWRDKK